MGSGARTASLEQKKSSLGDSENKAVRREGKLLSTHSCVEAWGGQPPHRPQGPREEATRAREEGLPRGLQKMRPEEKLLDGRRWERVPVREDPPSAVVHEAEVGQEEED